MALGHLKKVTPQSQRAPGMPGELQAKNSAGGYSFEIGKWDILNRFLIIGSEGGSYYSGEHELTVANAKNLLDCIKEDGERVVREITEVSLSGRAPKNDPALFALAAVSKHGDDASRRAAFAALSSNARIGTHVYNFVIFREAMEGGWGRGMKKAVKSWYLGMPLDKLALQAVKYKQRGGWSHRDLLRLSKPKPDSQARDSLFSYMVNGELAKNSDHELVVAAEQVKNSESAQEVAELISTFNLPREAVPNQFLKDKVVWEALLHGMPLGALVRNLGKMASTGLLNQGSDGESFVRDKLTEQDAIKYSRIHPMQILMASKVFASGKGVKGKLAWTASPGIIEALDQTFVMAFQNAVPSGKRWIIGVDVSASMGFQYAASCITCSEAAAAMALLTTKIEQNTMTFGFDKGFKPVHITTESTLQDALAAVKPWNYGGTDCALPMMWAGQNKIEADVFMVITDNETKHGSIHPFQALRRYRDKTGIDAKLIVVGMTANNFSIADPSDPGMLDIAGFDSAVPRLASDFARGYKSMTVARESIC